MSRFRNRHWRPTRTAGIFPALIRRYTVRRLTWRYSRTSSVVRNVSSIMRSAPRRRHRWKLDREDRAALGVITSGNVTAVLLHDAVGDREPQPGAFADFLGRVKRLEQPAQRFVGNAGAGVAHGCDDAAILRGRRDLDSPAV